MKYINGILTMKYRLPKINGRNGSEQVKSRFGCRILDYSVEFTIEMVRICHEMVAERRPIFLRGWITESILSFVTIGTHKIATTAEVWIFRLSNFTDALFTFTVIS